jgi:hypothetical protein
MGCECSKLSACWLGPEHNGPVAETHSIGKWKRSFCLFTFVAREQLQCVSLLFAIRKRGDE